MNLGPLLVQPRPDLAPMLRLFSCLIAAAATDPAPDHFSLAADQDLRPRTRTGPGFMGDHRVVCLLPVPPQSQHLGRDGTERLLPGSPQRGGGAQRRRGRGRYVG